MDKEIYYKEEKMHRHFFYIYVLKELLPKNFSWIFSKMKLLRRLGKASRRDKH